MADSISYTPTTWADGADGGTPITAARLNNLESGVTNAVKQTNTNAADIKTLGDSVSPLKKFYTSDKSSVTLSFKSSNHSAALLFIDNNGNPSVIYLNCKDSTSKAIAGQSFGVTFTSNKTAVIKAPSWSYGVVISPAGDECSISVA